MAKVNNTNQPSRPFAELTQEAIDHLDNIKAELDTAAGDLDALEELGIDVSRLRDRIQWGYKAREVIMNRFGTGQSK